MRKLQSHLSQRLQEAAKMTANRRLETYLKLPLRGRIITANELAMRTGRTVPALYKWEAQGTFPKRIRLSGRSVGWNGDEVADWFESIQNA